MFYMGEWYCKDMEHEWGQFEDGTLLDDWGHIIQACIKCGYQTDWLLK